MSEPEPGAAPRLDLDRLRRALGRSELAWLVERVRKRVGEGAALTGPVTLATATVEQRRAVDLLLGRAPGDGRSLTVPLTELDRLVRTSGLHQDGLRAAVEALTGPIPDRRAQAAAEAAAWEAAFAPLDELAYASELAGPWWTQHNARALLRRLAGGDPVAAGLLAADTARVLSSLPVDGGVTLAVFAARAAGDAHALDAGRPLATLVQAAIESWLGSTRRIETAAIPRAELRRTVWAGVGVGLDELSSRVLAIGLPGGGGSALGRVLAVHREAGEPCVLTLRELTRAAAAGRDADLGVGGLEVYVCENPAVVEAAANELGAACPPLVCVEGQPSVAARTLLVRLHGRRARLRYHGDFDWGGLRIAAVVFGLTEARPWRYDGPAYLQAVRQGLGSPLVTGEPCDSPWDPSLRAAIERHRVRVEEEQQLPLLLDDLARSAEFPGSAA